MLTLLAYTAATLNIFIVFILSRLFLVIKRRLEIVMKRHCFLLLFCYYLQLHIILLLKYYSFLYLFPLWCSLNNTIISSINNNIISSINNSIMNSQLLL